MSGFRRKLSVTPTPALVGVPSRLMALLLGVRNGISFKPITTSTRGSVTWQRQEFDVVAYGADDTGLTDASSAIQDAIDAAEALNGGTILFPEGTYKLSSSLNLGAQNKKIKLSGYGATLANDSGVKAIFVDGTGHPGSLAFGMKIEGFVIDAANTTNTVGIFLRDQDRVTIEDCYIKDQGIGIHFSIDENDSGYHWVEETHVLNTFLSGCTTGVEFANDDSVPASGNVVSFFETQFTNVGIQGSTTGILIERYTSLTRSRFDNVVMWPAGSGTGWSIDGDMYDVQADLHVEASANTTVTSGVTIGANASNMNRWQPHWNFVDDPTLNGVFTAKITDASNLLYPALLPLGALGGWGLGNHNSGTTPLLLTLDNAGDFDLTHQEVRFVGTGSGATDEGYMVTAIRIPDDLVDNAMDYAILLHWYSADASPSGKVEWAITVNNIGAGEGVLTAGNEQRSAFNFNNTASQYVLQSDYFYFTDGDMSRGDLLNIVIARDADATSNTDIASVLAVTLAYKRNT